MFYPKGASLALVFLAAACASTPAPRQLAATTPLGVRLDALSRIEIAQNLHFDRKFAQQSNVGALPVSEAHSAHEASVTANADSAFRVRGKNIHNRDNADTAFAVFHPIANDAPPGWLSDNDAFVHMESGLSCPMAINFESESSQYSLQQIFQFDEAGRDVACSFQSSLGGVAITVFATYWPEISIEEHMAGAVAAIYKSNAVTEEIGALVVDLAAEADEPEAEPLFTGIEEPLAGGFNIGELNGVPAKTSIWLVKTLDWHVKVRATYPLADDMSELVCALYFATSHISVRAKNLVQPIAPGIDV